MIRDFNIFTAHIDQHFLITLNSNNVSHLQLFNGRKLKIKNQ
jgi:hypothetical protein